MFFCNSFEGGEIIVNNKNISSVLGVRFLMSLGNFAVNAIADTVLQNLGNDDVGEDKLWSACLLH